MTRKYGILEKQRRRRKRENIFGFGREKKIGKLTYIHADTFKFKKYSREVGCSKKAMILGEKDRWEEKKYRKYIKNYKFEINDKYQFVEVWVCY